MEELIVGQWHPAVLEGKRRAAGRSHYFLTTSTPVFTREQIDLLKSLVDAENEPAGLEGYGIDNLPGGAEAHRRTRVRWLNVLEQGWAYEIIWAQALQANELLQLDIVPLHDTMQLARYDADEQGFFRWHSDIVPEDMTRKMSISVPLSDSSEFDGGVFEFNENGAIKAVPQRAGCPVIFPSWVLHRVTPVTRGSRYSLVAWIRGPAWR
jgi:predicted 2-oxoglutarate/Fe(II)-dependent dioxygenase YbiX